MTLADALRDAAGKLERAGCPSPRVDAEHLLAHALGLTRTGLYADSRRVLTESELSRVEELVARRERREPLAYVLGEWGFRRLTLRVDARALIPRPETEIVVERCLALLDGTPEPCVLDVGVGSGAIALALADEHPSVRVTGVDLSADALELARANAAATGLGERVVLLEHDLQRGFGTQRFDLVVSNPPYVQPDELPSLEPEVRDWEPRSALVANGATRSVAEAAREALRPGGWLVLEVAAGQARPVGELLDALGYRDVTMTSDLAGEERVVEAQWAS